MATSDCLAIVAIGAACFFGALQVSHPKRHTYLFIRLGFVIGAAGLLSFAFNSQNSGAMIPIMTVVLIPLFFAAWDLSDEAKKSFYVEEYIHIWERNGINFDESKGVPNSRLRLTQQIDGETIKPCVLSLPIQKSPARFTPVVQSLYDSLEEGTDVWISIWGKNLNFDDSKLQEWRPVLDDTTNGQQYWGVVERSIHHGKSKVGPNGVIKVNFPVGDFKVEYKIDGETRRGKSFSKEGHFIVHVYDATKKQLTPDTPHSSTQ